MAGAWWCVHGWAVNAARPRRSNQRVHRIAVRLRPLFGGRAALSSARHFSDPPRHYSDMPDSRLAALLFLFVGSGVMQPLLISTLGYNGAYDRSTLVSVPWPLQRA